LKPENAASFAVKLQVLTIIWRYRARHAVALNSAYLGLKKLNAQNAGLFYAIHFGRVITQKNLNQHAKPKERNHD
jgi:hypothetical protein